MADYTKDHGGFDEYDLTSGADRAENGALAPGQGENSLSAGEQKKTPEPLRRGYVYMSGAELDGEPPVDELGEELPQPEHRDYMPIRFRRNGRVGIVGGLMYAVFILGVSVVLACMAWMFASDVLSLNKEEVSAVVTLPRSIFTQEEDEDGDKITVADIDYVATELKNAGIIEYKFLFKL